MLCNILQIESVHIEFQLLGQKRKNDQCNQSVRVHIKSSPLSSLNLFLHQMILKLLFSCCHNISSLDPLEGANQPLEREIIANDEVGEFDQPEEKEDDLDPADDGEASEESHGSSNKTQLGLGLDLLVSLDVVKGRCAKVDLYQLKC